MAALCFMDVVSFGMSKAATSLLKAKKIENTAQVLLTSSRIMSNAASFGMCANAGMATGFAMYDKYYIQGQAIDSDTKWEVASLVMSVVGCVVSGKGILNNSKKLGTMLQHEGFTNTLRGEMLELANGIKSKLLKLDNRGAVDLSFYGLGKSGRNSTPVDIDSECSNNSDNNLFDSTGKFKDYTLENNYQKYVKRKTRKGQTPRDRLDWKKASEYWTQSSPVARGNNFNKKS